MFLKSLFQHLFRKLGYMKRKIKTTQRLRGLLFMLMLLDIYLLFAPYIFLPTIETQLNRESHNSASEIPSYTTTGSCSRISKVPSWMLSKKSGRQRPLSDDKMHIAHNYILINYVEVLTFMRYVILFMFSFMSWLYKLLPIC